MIDSGTTQKRYAQRKAQPHALVQPPVLVPPNGIEALHLVFAVLEGVHLLGTTSDRFNGTGIVSQFYPINGYGTARHKSKKGNVQIRNWESM